MSMSTAVPKPGPPEIEMLACRESPVYFVDRYCRIYDPTPGVADWIPFALWREQKHGLDVLDRDRLIVILKARQLGWTWLVLCYVLWLMIFQPAATILIFSKRDDEAIELLDFRLRGVYERLPDFLKPDALVDSAHELALENGSRALAFPTTGGRSYTATLVLVDEADYLPGAAQGKTTVFDALLNAVKPTIDGGGKLVLLSTADKSKPTSGFKRIYTEARAGRNDYTAIFSAWSARPDRDARWYDAQRRDIVARTGATDDLYQEYPATDAEALAPRSLDKRIPVEWLKRCYREAVALIAAVQPPVSRPPAIPGLLVFAPPVAGKRYVIGADPAEGNPTSDPSAVEVVDLDTGEQAASLAGRFEPATFAGHTDTISQWYNRAPALVERNNHGHAVLLWLRDNSRVKLLGGIDGNMGWLTTTKSKALLYDHAGETFRDGDAVLHGLETYSQLASIEGATLRAPEGEHDDRSVAFVLGLKGRDLLLKQTPDSSCWGPELFAVHRGPFG